MDKVICLILGLISALAILFAGYSIDDKNNRFRKVKLSSKTKKIFIFKDKKGRDDFTVTSIVIELFAYFLLISSVIFFVITFINLNTDLHFIFLVYMFCIMALATILYIIELAYYFIVEIKNDWRNRDE